MKKDSPSSTSSSPSPPPPPLSSINVSNLRLILILLPFVLLMTIKGGTSQACAACKYQRRRCSKECVLAPYFPAEKAKEFQNAHRLFGVRNIMNILKQVPPQQKEDAMTSIVFESDMRAQYPVRGCMGIISQLHIQLQQAIDELRMVQSKIAMCREQFQYSNTNNQIMPPNYNNYSSSSSLPRLHLGITTTSKNDNDQDGVPIFPHYNCGTSEMPIEFLGNGMSPAAMNGIYADGEDNMVKPSLRSNQNPYFCLDPLQPNLVASSSQVGYPIHQELDVSHYDDIPFDTIADDRLSHIESKEACESSEDSALKDSIHTMDVSQRELKNAAAFFSLTSVK